MHPRSESTRNLAQYTRHPGFVLLLLAPLAYLGFVGRFGWSDTDDGFIFGYAWRVANRAVPYLDFFYARPPLSPVLHALYIKLLPEQFSYLFSRLFALYEIAAYSFAAAYCLSRAPGQTGEAAIKWPWLGLAGFIVSASCFTPMPWHTIDGIVFCTFAIGILVFRKGAAGAAGAGILLFLGCLAKQSFYPLAVALPIWLVLQKRYKDGIVLGGVLGLLGMLLAATLHELGALEAFLRQTVGATSLADAIDAGIDAYWKGAKKIFLATAALSIVVRLLFRKWRTAPIGPLELLLVALYCVFSMVRHAIRGTPLTDPYFFGLYQFLAIAAVLWVAARLDRRPAFTGPLLPLLAVAWCASISWGFQTPALFAVPLLFAGQQWASRGSPPGARIAAVFLASAALAGIANTLIPYRDGHRQVLTCDLAAASDKLALVMTSERNCEKAKEAFALLSSYPAGSAALFPAFSLAYFVTGKANPMPIDWPMAAELAGEAERYAGLVEQKLRYAIVYNDEQAAGYNTITPGCKYCMPQLVAIQHDWPVIRRETFYTVHRNPRWPVER